MCESADSTSRLINAHLKRCNLHQEAPAWLIKESPLGDRGIFARCPINPGETIFLDAPLILGPRAGGDAPEICVSCFKRCLRLCSQGCGLPICSQECSTSTNHQQECLTILNWRKGRIGDVENPHTLLKCLCPIKSLFLDAAQKELALCLKAHPHPEHGFEVDLLKDKLQLKLSLEEEAFMRRICAVMDANAFEVIVGDEEDQSSLRGLYPLASLANHNCLPNTMHVFDCNHRMVVKASVFIPEGTEIFHSYTRVIWSTLVRRLHLLQTKHFCCGCWRCKDPTEFGSYLGAVLCRKCGGLVVAEDPLKTKGAWRCVSCAETLPGARIGALFSVLGCWLGNLNGGDAEEVLAFLNGKVMKWVAPSNQVAIELKYKLVWVLGHQPGYKLQELSYELLEKKRGLCEELLHLLCTLGTGSCKMRGLLLYELSCCLRELQRRIPTVKETNNNSIVPEEELHKVNCLLEESSEILQYDVSAPRELKRMWQCNKNK